MSPTQPPKQGDSNLDPGRAGRWVLAALILLTALGGWLRLTGLTQRGLWYYDEGYYVLESQFYASAVGQVGAIARRAAAGESLAELKETVGGWNPSTPKPLHSLLLAPFSAVSPHRFTPHLLFTAALGTASIGLVFLLGRAVYGARAGALAAAFCAVSEYAVHFSRSLMAETDSGFFFLLGTLLFVVPGRRPQRRALFSGLALGLSVACNYRWMILLPLFLPMEFFPAWRSRGGAPPLSVRAPMAALLLACGMAAPALLFQAPYSLLAALGRLPDGIRSYFDILFNDFLNPGANPHWTDWMPHRLYFDVLLYSEGFVGLAGAAFALCRAATRKRPAEWLIAALGWGLIVFYSLIRRGDNYRAVSLCIPFFNVLAAAGLMAVVQAVAARVPAPRRAAATLTAILLAAVVATGVLRSWRPVALKSGLPQTVRFVQNSGEAKLFSTLFTVHKAVLGRDNAFPVPASVAELKDEALKNGVRWFVVESKKYYEPSPAIDWTETQCPLAASFPNPQPGYWPLLMSYYGHPDLNRRLMESKDGLAAKVYDLKDCLK